LAGRYADALVAWCRRWRPSRLSSGASALVDELEAAAAAAARAVRRRL
jgi:hypothetical protein